MSWSSYLAEAKYLMRFGNRLLTKLTKTAMDRFHYKNLKIWCCISLSELKLQKFPIKKKIIISFSLISKASLTLTDPWNSWPSSNLLIYLPAFMVLPQRRCNYLEPRLIIRIRNSYSSEVTCPSICLSIISQTSFLRNLTTIASLVSIHSIYIRSLTKSVSSIPTKTIICCLIDWF
jgi:hypothetical protein